MLHWEGAGAFEGHDIVEKEFQVSKDLAKWIQMNGDGDIFGPYEEVGTEGERLRRSGCGLAMSEP
jgi:hypothetical protein